MKMMLDGLLVFKSAFDYRIEWAEHKITTGKAG